MSGLDEFGSMTRRLYARGLCPQLLGATAPAPPASQPGDPERSHQEGRRAGARPSTRRPPGGRQWYSVSAADPGANPFVAAVFRTKRLLRERCSATCPRRRRPGQVRHTQGGLQITADLARLRGSSDWAVVRPYRDVMDGSSQPYRVVMPPVVSLWAGSCVGSDAHWCSHVGCDGSVGLDRGSAFWAEKWAALGDGPPGAVDDEGESHFRDFSCGLDCPVGGASSGLGLDFCGHGLPPVIALGALRASARAAAS